MVMGSSRAINMSAVACWPVKEQVRTLLRGAVRICLELFPGSVLQRLDEAEKIQLNKS